MKKILIGALMVITSYGAQSQDNLIDVEVSQTPTTEEYQMIQQVEDTVPHYRVGPPHFGHFPPNARIHSPMMINALPRPEKVIRKGNKVILIFDRNEFENFRRWDLLRKKRVLEIGKEWQKRVGHNSIRRDYLERNPNFKERY